MSVLHGTHFNRGLCVHKIIYEVCRILQFKQFLAERIETEGHELLKDLINIQTYKRDFKEEASAVVELIVEDQSKFFENFNTFLKTLQKSKHLSTTISIVIYGEASIGLCQGR